MAQADPQNILLVHFGQLGDVVLALPAVKAVRERFPNAHLTTLTGLVPAEVIRISGLADDTIAVDRVELRDGPKLRSIATILRLVRGIRARRFDFVIDLHSLKETNLLARVSGAECRLLANRGNRSFHSLGNYDPAPPAEDRGLPLSQTYMRVLGPLGVSDPPGPVIIEVEPDLKRSFKDRLPRKTDRALAGFFPGAGHPDRCWPLERFAQLARRTSTDGFQNIVFLGPEELGMRDAVEAAFDDGTLIIDDLSISEFLAAVSELDVFVTNDTGPMHMAALGGVPIVLVMHSEAPVTYLPLASQLNVINTAPIKDIPVDDVYAGVKAVTSQSK